MSGLPLNDHQVELWCVLLNDMDGPALYDECRSLLSEEEIRREQKFTHKGSQLQFLVGRALLRTALSHYLGCDPRTIAFQRNSHGKATLESPAGVPLEFSLSYAQCLVACAFALHDAVGLDVERDNPSFAPLELARRFFTAAEADALANLPPPQQSAAFLKFWTLKEAFAKALGVGLSVSLSAVDVSLSTCRPSTVFFHGLNGESASNWQFAHLRLASRYQAAIAVRKPAAEQLMFSMREPPWSNKSAEFGWPAI